MNKKKKRKGFDRGGMRCPYCGSPVVYRSADGIYRDNSRGTMLYVCSRYPECDASMPARIFRSAVWPITSCVHCAAQRTIILTSFMNQVI